MRERKNVKSFGAGLFQKAGRSPQRAKYHSCISSKISARYFCGKHPTQTGPLRRLCAPHRTKKKKTPKGVFFFLVRKMGLEPTHHRYWLLRPARLPFRHSRREQPLSYHEKGPAVKSPATKEVWRWLCGGSTGISPPALRSNGHQPAFTCRFAILPTSPAASGDHPVKTVTSLIFWNPSPA